jgi:prepilin-type N-terminal cleavage/methylation domain-containing protein
MKRNRNAIFRPRGFTLVEIMIATLVFSVGMMAVISMEFSALRAYTSGRDLTVATDLGYRTISLMRTESVAWGLQDKGNVLSGATDSDGNDVTLKSFYVAGSPVDPGNEESLLGVMIDNPWQWQTVTLNPVNERLIPGVSGRYCVFVRGALDDTLNADPINGTKNPMVRSQIAVVYPGGEQGFGNQVNNLGDCNALPGCTGATIGLLQPEGLDNTQTGVDALPPLEQCGWRAVYMGAVVTRRNG